MQYKHIFQFLILISMAVFIVACNDDDYSFVSRNIGMFTKDNVQPIATGVTDGVSASYSYQELSEIMAALRTVIDNRAINVSTIDGTCAVNPGTITFPAGLAEIGTINGTLTFNSFCLAGGTLTGDVIFDGDADFEIIYDNTSMITKLDLLFTNITLTEGGYTIANSGAITLEGSQLITAITMDYVGSDGRQYQATNLDKTGTYVNGYSIGDGSAISDPDYGTVKIKTKTPMSYNNCSNGKPVSGTLVVTGENGDVMEVNYDGCANYTICLNGGTTCDSYSW